MASVRKNIEYIKTYFDTHSDFVISKLEQDGISISGKSSKYIRGLIYPIVNYIDFVNNGNTTGLESLSTTQITNLYINWVNSIKDNFNTLNYIESNTILIDYRINDIGLYWVDLNSFYSSDMVFRMDNCGRMSSSQNLLELREYTSDGYNHSRVAVAINVNGEINQIRGVSNIKPDMIYSEYIFDLFMNYNKITGFNLYNLDSNTQDFGLRDLTTIQRKLLKSKKPYLFDSSII
jgi:hypothetical protein